MSCVGCLWYFGLMARRVKVTLDEATFEALRVLAFERRSTVAGVLALAARRVVAGRVEGAEGSSGREVAPRFKK